MSLTITKRVTNAKLSKILPRNLAGFASNLHLAEPITLVVFDDEVVISSLARKAIRKLPTDSRGSTLFAARDFTIEARQLIESHGAQIMSQTNFCWSDERYETIRVGIGASVKTPDWI